MLSHFSHFFLSSFFSHSSHLTCDELVIDRGVFFLIFFVSSLFHLNAFVKHLELPLCVKPALQTNMPSLAFPILLMLAWKGLIYMTFFLLLRTDVHVTMKTENHWSPTVLDTQFGTQFVVLKYAVFIL